MVEVSIYDNWQTIPHSSMIVRSILISNFLQFPKITRFKYAQIQASIPEIKLNIEASRGNMII
jgi:hypothetical protein